MRLHKESLLTFVGGAVLTAILTLAGKSYLSTESAAEEAQSKNFSQQTEIAELRVEQEGIKKDLDWLKKAMFKLLLDRGIQPPPAKEHP